MTAPAATSSRPPWLFRVLGRESVVVPAGSFDAFKASMEAIDGDGGHGILWISPDVPRTTVRSEFQLPALQGGAVVRTELTSRDPGS